MSTPDRDAATAALTRLLLRLDALRPGFDPHEHLVVRHHVLGALRIDEHLREFVELGEPDPPALVSSSRDIHQAETVRLLRELSGPNERIVLMLHNGHAQRVPMQLLPGIRAWSAGGYLAADLGADYFVLGVTARGGTTTDVRLDEQARQGFEVFARRLGPPAEGSVEQPSKRACRVTSRCCWTCGPLAAPPTPQPSGTRPPTRRWTCRPPSTGSPACRR